MLRIHSSALTNFRTWGSDATESDSGVSSPMNLTAEQSVHCADSWIDVDRELEKTSSAKENSTSFASADCSSPKEETALNATVITESQILDTTTFPTHALHLLPSEPNGTWHSRVGYALRNPNGNASTFRDVLTECTYEFNAPELLRKLELVAADRKEQVNCWLNQAFAEFDLIEMHGRAQHLIPAISMPNMRQLDQAIDSATDFAQSLRERRSESQLLQAYPDDKYIFAQVIGRRAVRILLDQGICQDWQFVGDQHRRMLHAMQCTLINTFLRMQQSYTNVSLCQARPQWVADRQKGVWHLELDIGRVAIEVGPGKDKSLIELGRIITGFELPESSGCLPTLDLDRHVQGIEDEWQLLEP